MVVKVHTAQTSIVLFLFQKLAIFKDMSALLKIFFSMAMPLCRKCFSTSSTYVLPLNFFFKEVGFATVSDLPAFTVCLFELCYCLWLACFHCLPVWILCYCLWSACFHHVLSELSLVCLLSLSACLATVWCVWLYCCISALLLSLIHFLSLTLW